MAKGFNPPGQWGPRSRGFSMGVVQHPGHVIHFTGQVAWDASEKIVGKGDVAVQTRKCFENIRGVLHAVGGRMEDIVSITTYFLDRSHLVAIQRVRGEFLDAGIAPVSISIMVAGLGHKDFLVELHPIAVVPADRFIDPE